MCSAADGGCRHDRRPGARRRPGRAARRHPRRHRADQRRGLCSTSYKVDNTNPSCSDTGPGNFIIGNVTYANEDSGINIYTGSNNTLVANNVAYDNGDHGIDNLNVTGGRIIGNTVYYNCTDGINVEGTSGNDNIENNVGCGSFEVSWSCG